MRRALTVLVVLAALAVVAAWGAWTWGGKLVAEPFAFGAAGEERAFEVRAGESAGAVIARLEREGFVRSARVARLWQTRVLGDPPLQTGVYRFRSPASTLTILRMLRTGEVATAPLTVIEGLTIAETAEAISRTGLGDAARLLEAFRDPSRIRDLDPEAADLEGYLFPETYRLPVGVSERGIAERMVAEFRSRFERDVRPLVAPGDSRTPREIVILASLVEKEAKLDAERPLIAAVYANRLRRGIGLYADPTIIHALKLEGRWDGDIRRRDLAMESPWNTYRVLGLPPGPISNPGRASLEATANPARTRDLFFVADGTGGHTFTETYDAHQKNVAKLRALEKQIQNDTAEPAEEAPPPAAAGAPAATDINPTAGTGTRPPAAKRPARPPSPPAAAPAQAPARQGAAQSNGAPSVVQR